MKLQIEYAKTGRVLVRGVEPEKGEDTFSWTAVPPDLITLLDWHPDRQPANYDWIVSLCRLLSENKELQAPEPQAPYLEWMYAVRLAAHLFRAGESAEAAALLQQFRAGTFTVKAMPPQ